MYLTLGGGPNGGDRGGSKPDFRKDDLWVVGSGPELQGTAAGRVGDRLASWVAVARSCWHGPNREGRCASGPHAATGIPVVAVLSPRVRVC